MDSVFQKLKLPRFAPRQEQASVGGVSQVCSLSPASQTGSICVVQWLWSSSCAVSLGFRRTLENSSAGTCFPGGALASVNEWFRDRGEAEASCASWPGCYSLRQLSVTIATILAHASSFLGFPAHCSLLEPTIASAGNVCFPPLYLANRILFLSSLSLPPFFSAMFTNIDRTLAMQQLTCCPQLKVEIT